jgi:hypothetical protein
VMMQSHFAPQISQICGWLHPESSGSIGLVMQIEYQRRK